jgi:hypothetical protein
LPGRKVRSGCRGALCERGLTSEAFELVNEASGLAFGVAGGEVAAAEVAVGRAGGQQVPDRANALVCARLLSARPGSSRSEVGSRLWLGPGSLSAKLGCEVRGNDVGGHGMREEIALGHVAAEISDRRVLV